MILVWRWLPSTTPSSLGWPRASKHNVSLVILVHSAPSNAERRHVIRATWLSALPPDTLALFVMGTGGLSNDATWNIQQEQRNHSDLLLFDSMTEDYFTLTTKVRRAFVWLHHNIDFKFVLKADDDTFVRVDLLVQESQKLKSFERIYWGYFSGDIRPFDPSTTDVKLCDLHVPYAKGGGYILSADLVSFITENQERLVSHKAEDVAVGLWLGPLKMNRLHDRRFDTEYVSRGCTERYIVTHKQDVYSMQEKHKSLQMNRVLCSHPAQLRFSYDYKWNKLPSQCCRASKTDYSVVNDWELS
ncbi:hypothetical protein CAPTEDRAFT_113201 [Capitella teleta]|uniref:Hexosyltransferase n=1 Tax=Capitella teleta TaxID=283909 RepID=R7UCX2_CAPTE|nr:hypothetical protein CAPTEDRAFT_113201 [Capitella teleta]|eukprot:ELU01648.1 hypothetical protein CAPTEDRAFT_113201 [Capitella teleta]